MRRRGDEGIVFFGTAVSFLSFPRDIAIVHRTMIFALLFSLIL